MLRQNFFSRRKFLQSYSIALAGASAFNSRLPNFLPPPETRTPLQEFSYGDVTLASELHEKQLRETHAVLMSLNEDSLLKPLRQMSGQPAPGAELGGWYLYNPDYQVNQVGPGFAPACTFGQWISALARSYAITRDPITREKILRLNQMCARTITGDFYVNNRFPAYCYDKFVCGLIDSHQFAGDPNALAILEHTTNTALPHLPPTAIEHGRVWRSDHKEDGYTWDESYTNSENLFLAYQRGAGDRYRKLGVQYLDDELYGPLAENHSNLAGRHAYSHVNSLCSAMQAYLTLGSQNHLHAAQNGFAMLAAQSFATGGWGPDEQLRAPDSPDVVASLSGTHHSFETPCGSYAHFKLTRYLLRATGDPAYGDSMERVMYNTILGAKPLQPDGRTFYYSDYNFSGRKFYHPDQWPCCSGTHPQVAADYRINSYFRDSAGVYVNLYIPSCLRWKQSGASISLTQESTYPFDRLIRFIVSRSRPAEFTLNFRIPAWSEGASFSVNGKLSTTAATPGTFAVIRREWKTGDRVELNLLLKTRLEAVDARHPETVALLSGPLVLFPIASTQETITRSQLLAANKSGPQTWQCQSAAAPISLLPFFSIDDHPYSTYVKLKKDS